MSSTRERDAFPKTLSRCTRLMFSSTDASTSQWESSVFVSPIKAPALMILDEYGAEDRIRLRGSPVGMDSQYAVALKIDISSVDPQPASLY